MQAQRRLLPVPRGGVQPCGGAGRMDGCLHHRAVRDAPAVLPRCLTWPSLSPGSCLNSSRPGCLSPLPWHRHYLVPVAPCLPACLCAAAPMPPPPSLGRAATRRSGTGTLARRLRLAAHGGSRLQQHGSCWPASCWCLRATLLRGVCTAPRCACWARQVGRCGHAVQALRRMGLLHFWRGAGTQCCAVQWLFTP